MSATVDLGAPAVDAATCPRCKTRDVPLWRVGEQAVCGNCCATRAEGRPVSFTTPGWARGAMASEMGAA